MGKFTINKIPSDYQEMLQARLKFWRKKAGYTQQDLASRSMVSLGSLKRFEQDGEISLMSFLRLFHILGKLDDMDAVLAYDEHLDAVAKRFNK